MSYILRHEQETILVVANLSRFTQPVELDLSAFKTLVPIELFGRTKFPAITDIPYFLTLGPHNFFWFSLEPRSQPQLAQPETDGPSPLPAIAVTAHWQDLFTGKPRAFFEALLPEYLKSRPWFSGKAGTIKLVTLKEVFNVPLPDETTAALAFLQIEYVDANAELFALPLAFTAGTAAGPGRENAIAALTLPEDPQFGVVHEAFVASAFARSLLELIRRRERLHNEQGEVEAIRLPVSRDILNGLTAAEPSAHNTDEGNVTLIFGDQIVLKFFRRPGSGVNPELEIGRFLTEKNFPHSPKLLGALEYHAGADANMTLAVAKAFVPHAKNGWKFTLDATTRYYDHVFAEAAQGHNPSVTPAVGPLKPVHHHPPAEAAEHVETYLESARLLGERTAELHLALASGEEGGEFFPEPMTPHYLRGTFQAMRFLAVQNLRLLRKQIKSLPPELVPVAQQVADLESAILERYRRLIEQTFEARRIRIHGDLHLGQVLWTGRDFVFLDFEGDATKPISERRIKRSPLRDVARMLRSFHHAAYAGFHQQVDLGVISRENLTRFEPWIRHWNVTVSREYLQAYFRGLEKSELLPRDEGKLRVLLLAYLLNQVVDELGRELRLHSDNIRAPLQAIIYLTEEQPSLPSSASPSGTANAHAEVS